MNEPISASRSKPRSSRGRFWVFRAWIGMCVAVGLGLAGSQLLEIPHRSALRGYDNTFNYLWLRSAMVDADWDFRNDLQQCNTLTPEYRAHALGLPATPAGRVPNKYGVGWALLTVPWYLLADGTVALARATGMSGWVRDGFGPAYQVWIVLGHLALGLAALRLAIGAVERWIADRQAAVAGVVAVWAASSLLFYQTADIGMSHGAAFFAVALLAFALTRVGRATQPARWWLLAGAAFGLAVVTRFQLAVFVVPLAAALGRRKAPQADLAATGMRPNVVTPMVRARCAGFATGFASRMLLVMGGAAPFLLLQLWAWRVVYGRWLVFSYGAEGEGFHWMRPQLAASLFSPWHGLFYWHPFVLVGIAGLLGWAWSEWRLAWPWLIAVASTLYVNAAWWCWWFASAFGGRSFDAALLPAMAGAAWLFVRAGSRGRAVWWTVVVASGLWNFYVVLLYRSGAIPRNEPVSWAQMLEAARQLGHAIRF